MTYHKTFLFLLFFSCSISSFSQNSKEIITEEEFIEIPEDLDSARVESKVPYCGPIGIMAEYTGGYTEMMTFITDNFQLPEVAKDKIEHSVVYVQFTIEKNGKVSNVKILRGAHDEIDKEVIRVIKLMPDWTPEMENGKPLRSKFTLPIRICITNK